MTYRLNAGSLALVCVLCTAATAQDSVRFPKVTYEQLSPQQKAFADNIGAPPRNASYNNPPYNVYVRNPEFGARATAMSDYLRWNSSLPPRLSEFAILIAARQTSSDYEWYAHYPLAIKGGLDPKIAEAVNQNRRPEGMKDDEATIYDFATQIDRDKKISDATYRQALKLFGERGVIDITGIIGFYHFTSIILIAGNAERGPADVPRLATLPK